MLCKGTGKKAIHGCSVGGEADDSGLQKFSSDHFNLLTEMKFYQLRKNGSKAEEVENNPSR